MSSTNRPLFKDNGASGHGDSGVAVDAVTAVVVPTTSAAVDDSASSAASLGGDFVVEDRHRGIDRQASTHLIARGPI